MAGGKRSGAGRKPGSTAAKTKVAVDIAAQVLDSIDAKAKWVALLNCGDPKVTLDVMKYLTDRVHGKPAQRIEGDPDKPVAIVLKWGAPVEW